jgi:phosphoribosylformylglycinamidine synthase
MGTSRIAGRWDAALFGEVQSRIVVSVASGDVPQFRILASEMGVPWMQMGTVGGDRLSLDGLLDVPVKDMAMAYKGGLERALG